MHGGTGYLWVTGEAGCGRSHFLSACSHQAERAGWEVLQGQCTEETRSDPYGPFLSMLGLCFDKAGRLINDRSVYSIVDQISLDDVFEAVTDIPGMAVVAFGIKLGRTIFESRRRPQAEDELLNRNFEFILQVLKQIERKRQKPVFLALDDLHMASVTTYALIEYILTRIEDTRLLVVATWQADSPEEGETSVLRSLRRLVLSDHVMHLPHLSNDQMRLLLRRFGTQPLGEPLVSTVIEFSRGLPRLLVESIRLIELEGDPRLDGAQGAGASDSVIEALIARQLGQVGEGQRALLECASLIGQRIPLDLLIATPLGTYLGMGERALLSAVVELADQEALLAWDGEDAVRFTSPFVHRFLRDQARSPFTRRDHLHIAESLRDVDGDSHPARLARHYLSGGDTDKALSFALQSAEELSRSAAFPEAVQSYRLALEALERAPDRENKVDVECDILQAMSLAAEQAGDWDESLDRLEQALALSEGDDARQAEIYAGLGWLRFQRGQIQDALRHLRHSAELYEQLGDDQGQAQVDYYLGVLYSRQKEWQRAIACFERYLSTSEQAGVSEGRASAYTELGNLHRLQRNWPRAESFLQQGIDLAQAEQDFVVLAQGYHYLGICYAWQGKPESIEMLHQALDIVRSRTKQPAQEASIQNTLAETLVRLNRWQDAEAAFHASAEIKERLGDTAGLAMTYGGLGRLYFRQWRFDLAVEHLQKDIDILAEEFDANVAWIQQWTNWIAEARRLQGRLDQAERRLAEALALAERIPDLTVREQSRGYTHMLLSRLALDRGDLDTAEQECAAALGLLAGTWADKYVQYTAARLARLRGESEQARQLFEKALAAVERGEDIDRAQVYLEYAYFCRDMGNVEGTRQWAGRVVALARRLQNARLERLASQLMNGG